MVKARMILAEFRYCLYRVFLFFLGVDLKGSTEKVNQAWKLYFNDLSMNFNNSFVESDGLMKGLDSSEIKKMPIMTKQHLKADFDVNARFHRHTAGTTGEPTDIFLNSRELGLMLGVRSYCLSHYGIRLGDREARLWGRPDSGIKSSVKNFILNRKVFDPTVKDQVKEVLRMISWKPDYIYGYSSLVLEAANIVYESGLKVGRLKGVICTAETILPSQKNFIKNMFGCPVIEEYGSTEFDIIAFECLCGHRHLVNPWLFVEEVNNDIVITDISRETQKLIRYNVGDSGQLGSSGCKLLGSDVYLEEINGRSINGIAFSKTGDPFHSVEFARAIEAYMEFYQERFKFRIVQKELDGFSIGVSPCPKMGEEHLTGYLTEAIRKNTGFEVVFEIDHDFLAGKSHAKKCYFIQLMELDNKKYD